MAADNPSIYVTIIIHWQIITSAANHQMLLTILSLADYRGLLIEIKIIYFINTYKLISVENA